VRCFYSHALYMAVAATFRTPDFSDPGEEAYADGDVTVPVASLARCRDWAAEQSQVWLDGRADCLRVPLADC
jgi:hypothetical protein